MDAFSSLERLAPLSQKFDELMGSYWQESNSYSFSLLLGDVAILSPDSAADSNLRSASLNRLLADTSYRNCLDPRDRVFALCGLISGLVDDCPVVYRMSLQQVCWNIAMCIMRGSRRRDPYVNLLFEYCLFEDRLSSQVLSEPEPERRNHEEQHQRVPLWVPNFTAPMDTSRRPPSHCLPIRQQYIGDLIYQEKDPDKECKSSSRWILERPYPNNNNDEDPHDDPPTALIDNRVLQVYGKILGTCHVSSRLPDCSRDFYADCARAVLALLPETPPGETAYKNVPGARNPDWKPRHRSTREHMAETLTGISNAGHEVLYAFGPDHFVDWLKTLASADAAPPDVELSKWQKDCNGQPLRKGIDWKGKMKEMLLDLRQKSLLELNMCFAGGQPVIGISVPGVQDGDIVAFVPDWPWPAVLRSVTGHSGGEARDAQDIRQNRPDVEPIFDPELPKEYFLVGLAHVGGISSVDCRIGHLIYSDFALTRYVKEQPGVVLCIIWKE